MYYSQLLIHELLIKMVSVESVDVAHMTLGKSVKKAGERLQACSRDDFLAATDVLPVSNKRVISSN